MPSDPKYSIKTSTLSGIANAIRAKTGGSTPIDAEDFATEIEAIPSGATLITKNITANGTYNASSDNADGYSSVSVNVPSDPNEQLRKLSLGTATYVKISDENIVNSWIIPYGNKNCAYFSIKHRDYDWGPSRIFYGFGQDTQRNFLNLAYARDIGSQVLYNAKAYTVVLTSTVVRRLTGSLSVENNNAIYVRPSLLAEYKVASNWSAYGDVLKDYSEAPAYDSTTTYIISDVCKYNGKFYAYCKSDLTSSTGNAPTGTTEDNDYWEYLAEVNS